MRRHLSVVSAVVSHCPYWTLRHDRQAGGQVSGHCQAVSRQTSRDRWTVVDTLTSLKSDTRSMMTSSEETEESRVGVV